VVVQLQIKPLIKVLVVVAQAALELEQAKVLRLGRNTQLRLAAVVLVEHLPLIRGRLVVIHLLLGVPHHLFLLLRVLFLLVGVVAVLTEVVEETAVLAVVVEEVSQVELPQELETHHLLHHHKEVTAAAGVLIAVAAVVVQVPLELLVVVILVVMEVTELHLALAVHR
jgi:hypothetical protein